MKSPGRIPFLAFAVCAAFGIAAQKTALAEREKSRNGKSATETKKPQYGSWGFDRKGADLKTKPGDDFFRFANGAWLDRVQIPGDKPAYSLRLAMTDLTEERLHELMEGVAAKAEHNPATIEGKIGAFYKSFMNEAGVEKAGASPVKEKLAELSATKDRNAFAAQMGRQNADLEGTIFNIGIDVDVKNPSRYVLYVGQGGLGLPDR